MSEKEKQEVFVMAVVIVVVIALLYIPMGVLPILPRVAELEDRGESGI